ncbi:TetR/AcrR family transcriptional regulator C-terminal domain-containing protein [Paenibacillus sp. JX-17]|uniref:TetR/AcrR family transcriptional regulator C-terminal domain-containing protein n=1 Tax=Paenibacillus lacisoli TaxID=3064525 RepID=A0ABT9CHK5_9BACL|nr:TetR/AcrR family transcriptional regulator C-terminal domain-containing protein [Paenibacillus sp. JX-17]MDO7908762.1 TetR/AcrR family transcriptional regulator C-terminal domain-containing protein [Paenibacillus sp. JX-17]
MSNHELFSPHSSKHYSNQETNRLTREAICTALILLIQKQPFSKITITEIVKLAGVSRTAYYSNYSSKQDILIDLVDSLIHEINQNLLPYTDESTGKSKDPEKFISVLFKSIIQKRDIYTTLQDANFNYVILDCLNEVMLSQLQEKTDENIYRTYFNAGALYNVIVKWVQSGFSRTVEEMTQICVRYYHTPMSEG